MRHQISILLAVLLSVYCYCNGQDKKLSFAESFFNEHLQSLYMTKYEQRLECPASALDSILQESTYHIARFYDDMPFFYNDSSLIVFLKNDQDIDWNKADENCEFKNNMYIIFKKQQKNFVLSEFIHLPLDQGCMALNFTDININNDKLYLYQYGGNRFGTWGTELEFERSNNNWIHSNSKLFTTVDELDNTPVKIIWSKKTGENLPIEKLCFSDIFLPQELEWILDGSYLE